MTPETITGRAGGLLAALLLAASAHARLPLVAEAAQSSDRLDQIYYAQPHNSYQHSSKLTNWLDAGYRTLEIDVIDRGDWEKEAKGPYVAHDLNPMNANCSAAKDDRLGDCLSDIVGWMDRNAAAIKEPILVFVDMKASWDPASAWKSDEVAMLDDFVRKYLGNRLFTYRELLATLGSQPNRTGLKALGWPTLEQLKGKVIVVFTGGHIGAVNQRMNEARRILNGQNPAGPVSFLCPDVDSDGPNEISGAIDGISAADSAFFFCANMKGGKHDQLVLNRSAEYRQLIHQWSTAGDFAGTPEAASDSASYPSSYIAVAHGASAIGWDVTESLSDNRVFRPGWLSSIPLVARRRSLPGYFELRTPTQGKCVDVDGANYRNGTALMQYTCNNGTNQHFVYTAEGQLRPQGDNRYCADVDGGKGKQQAKLHIWGCDGGESERWAISPDGRFANRSGSWAFCMDLYQVNPADRAPLVLWPCNASDAAQKFDPIRVPDWNQTVF
jgi:hypothetical protein